jgi:outer membrane protease
VTAPPTLLPEPKIWSCGGGSVKYQVTANGLVLLETTPAVGFTVSKYKAKVDEITVKFDASNKSDKRTSALKIKKSGLVSTSCDDENFNRDSDSEDSESNDNNEESADD